MRRTGKTGLKTEHPAAAQPVPDAGARRSPASLAVKPVARKRNGFAFLRRAFYAGLMILVIAFAQLPVDRPTLAPREGMSLGQARQWGYQLQHVNAGAIPDAIDLLVVDYSRDGSEAKAYKPADVDTLRRKSDGNRRIVLAYVSIGEAENYRYYWRRSWAVIPPSWLGAENPEWKGNFPVRYWQAGWRNIIMQPRLSLLDRVREVWQFASRPYLDRIIEAGFDGVFLDRVDAVDIWKAENPNTEADMVNLVSTISAYAKRRRPGFLVVPQNGEELLRSADYRRAIDAIAKEDLLYGSRSSGQPNTTTEVRRSVVDLNRLKADNRPVFVVEYIADPAQRAQALKILTGFGYVAHFAERELRQAPESLGSREEPVATPPQ